MISHCVWLYHRFPLSLREVEEMMMERGVVVTYETIRQWWRKFGQTYANGLRRRRPHPGDKWHLDEVFITIGGKTHYLWRAVDQDGNVLDILVTSRRDAKAATRFFRKLLTGLRPVPQVLVTDKLASYPVAHRRLMRSVEHHRSKYLNNRAENSHQPTRQRERAMKKFTSPGSRKKSTWWLGWFRRVVRRYHRAEEGGLEPHGKLTTDLARNAPTTPTNTNPENSTLIFYGSPDTRNDSSPRSAEYPRAFGHVVTGSPQSSTAGRWPSDSSRGTRSPDWPRPPDTRHRGPTDPPQPCPCVIRQLELPNKLTMPPGQVPQGRKTLMHPRHRAMEFCDRFGLRLPILQAPMAGTSPPELAIAVAEAGGMGASGALQDSPQRIAKWARQFRAKSSGAFQINIWIPETSTLDPQERRERVHAASQFLRQFGAPPELDVPGPPAPIFSEQCSAMLAAQPTAISSIMGLFPQEFVTGMRERRIAWFCCATSLEEALAAEGVGADAIVAQGMEAGGHRGTFDQDEAERNQVGLFSLLPWFADHLRIPIIAAGGIADGRGVAAALSLGASAVQVGTALLRSPEAGISPQWSDALNGLAPEYTVTTRAYTGRLARAARTPYLTVWTTPNAPRPAPFPDQLHLVTRWRKGDPDGLDQANYWAGQSAALATTDPAGEIVTRMWRDATALLA